MAFLISAAGRAAGVWLYPFQGADSRWAIRQAVYELPDTKGENYESGGASGIRTHARFQAVYLSSKEAPYSRLGMPPCQSGPPGLGWAAVRYLPPLHRAYLNPEVCHGHRSRRVVGFTGEGVSPGMAEIMRWWRSGAVTPGPNMTFMFPPPFIADVMRF